MSVLPGGSRRDSVLAFSSDDTARSTIAQTLTGGPQKVFLRDGGLEEARDAVQSGALPGLIIIDISDNRDVEPLLDLVASITDRLPLTSKVILIGELNDVSFYRQLSDLGVADYLLKPITVHELRKSVIANVEGDSDDDSKRAKVIPVLGTRGGVGTTSIAASLASLAAHELNQKVLLLDLDLHFGTAGLYFDIEPGNGLSSAIEDPSRIDSLFLSSIIASHGPNLFILAAEEDPLKSVAVTDVAVDLLMQELSQSFDVIIVDMPNHTISACSGIFEVAESSVLVTDLTLSSLRDVIRMATAMNSFDRSGSGLKLVGNRFGHAKVSEISLGEFEKGSGRSFDLTISEDPRAARATERGETLVDSIKKGPVRTGMLNIIQQILDEEDDEAPVEEETKSRGFSWKKSA